MPAEGQSDDKNLQFSAIFEGMNLTYRDAVISRALGSRGQVSSDAANALNSAIQKSRVRVTGYRDSLRAPHTVLRDPVSQLAPSHPELAGAVLRVWVETQGELHDKVIEHLRTVGLEPEYVDHSTKKFRRTWPVSDWNSHRDKFLEICADEDFAEDDAALMLCYVTGRIPRMTGDDEPNAAPSSHEEHFKQFLDFLKDLPPTAPEWQREVPGFLDSLSALISAKEAELKWADEFDAILESMRSKFEDLLAFFEQDTHSWMASRVSRTADTSATLGLAERLQLLFRGYGPIHDRAGNISEERERARGREELQPQIIDLIQQIDLLMTEDLNGSGSGRQTGYGATKPAGSALPSTPPQVLHSTTAQEPSPTNSLQEALTAVESLPGEPRSSAGAHGVTDIALDAVQSENVELRASAGSLVVENQDLRDEVEALKTELFSSQEREDSWRLAYRSAVDGSVKVEEEEQAPEVDSVNDAVEVAKSRFRQEIVFAPNSESTIEDNPFSDPLRVWEALRWLGTTYYASKMGRLRVTDFDQSIKEACGWWYKGDQGETTLSRYEKSYTTRLDGKRHWLAEHIGKGTSFDARYTIRIAFNWDKDRRQVIVGYIGRHQQTDAS